MRPEAYAFLWGGEGPIAGRWYYASERIYILHLVALLLWFLCGALLSLHQGTRSRKPLIVHMLLTVLWVLVSIASPE